MCVVDDHTVSEAVFPCCFAYYLLQLSKMAK